MALFEKNTEDRGQDMSDLKKPAIWVGCGLGLSVLLALPVFYYLMRHFTDTQATTVQRFVEYGYALLLTGSLFGALLLVIVVFMRSSSR